jgi:hypothetical protein
MGATGHVWDVLTVGAEVGSTVWVVPWDLVAGAVRQPLLGTGSSLR